MIKMNKVVMLLATAALATAASAQVNNWVSADGTVWKNGTNEFCWRSASWTPATAAVGCDGAIVAAAAPAPVAKPAPAPAPAAVAPAAAPAKVTYAADAFFGFDKAVILPAGKVKLDDLIAKVKDINLEVIVAVGHTDATGPASYNQALSVKRAGAVKAYLVSKGIDANRIYSEGKGETSPVADNSTRSGRSKNRRVEIEVVGAR
jgi:OOP family OmpA-OmpF porin|tara:strand:- start:722 stop:1336 length:615 start_codon:yes stop_codon:yes gene_type:complete